MRRILNPRYQRDVKRGLYGPRRVRYTDDNQRSQYGIELERNGNLVLVENEDTGEQDWRASFEVERRDY